MHAEVTCEGVTTVYFNYDVSWAYKSLALASYFFIELCRIVDNTSA